MSDSFPYDRLPISTVPDLSDRIERTTELIGRGGYGTVYKGRWLVAPAKATPATIAIKIIELVPLRDEAERTKRFKQITRELSLWCSVQHENILPLLGIARINGDTNVPAFVCPLMENGNAREFCSRNPRFSPMSILYDIIKGLHYLHTSKPEIVHGDIKAVNVLIDNRCRACLCDFGHSRFLIDNTLWKTTATYAGGTVRWMAPELLNGDASTPTKKSDIYAYAMTCYEILSGDIPFQSVSNDMAIPIKVMKGQRPGRMESFHSYFMWDIITRCWEQEPEHRLPTEKVLWLLRAEVDWKGAEEALSKTGEKEATLAKVEKDIAVLKEQMVKAEVDLKALKEEKEKVLEDARHDIAENERELNSLNVSKSTVKLLENRVERLEREVFTERIKETVVVQRTEAVELPQEGPKTADETAPEHEGTPGDLSGLRDGDNRRSPAAVGLSVNPGASSAERDVPLELRPVSSTPSTNTSGIAEGSVKARALYSHKGSVEDPSELTFAKGDVFEIIDRSRQWWDVVNKDGEIGIVPFNYVLVMDQ